MSKEAIMKKIMLSFLTLSILWAMANPATAVESGWEKHSIGAQKSPIYLYVDDIDGDGRRDVAATSDVHPNGSNSEVAWYRNTGEKAMWEKTIISSSDPDTDPIFGAAGIVISDIDGDGRKDAVVVCGNVLEAKGDVYWFKAPEDPASSTWTRFEIETGVADSYFKVYTIDANQDGTPDIVAGGNQGAVLFLNPGNPDQQGSVWTKVALPEGTGSSLYIDDINNDGKIDLINSHTGLKPDYAGNVSWIDVINENGQIIMNRTMVDPLLVRAFDVTTIDVNEDGRKDVAVSVFKVSELYWYEQPADNATPWAKHLITNTYSGTDLYTGDIDGDGKADLIVSGLFTNKISFFSARWENGEALWTEHPVDKFVVLPGDISLDDIDGDGDLDIVLAGMGANQIIWYENCLNEQQNCIFSYMLGKDSSQLASLRAFRDSAVARIPGGSQLIASYYEFSQIAIQYIELFKSIFMRSRFLN